MARKVKDKSPPASARPKRAGRIPGVSIKNYKAKGPRKMQIVKRGKPGGFILSWEIFLAESGY